MPSARELPRDPLPPAPSEIEPYRPEMLPRAPEGPNPLSAHDRFEALRRELNEQAGDRAAQTRSQRPAFGEGGGEVRRDGSIREQLLKKPLSSLLRK